MLLSMAFGAAVAFGVTTPRLFAGPVSFWGPVPAVTDEAGFAPMKPRERSGGFSVDFIGSLVSSDRIG